MKLTNKLSLIGVLMMVSSCNSNEIISSSSLLDDSSSEENIDLNTYVSSIERLNDSKTYLKVDGKPYAIRGGQIRIDGLLNRAEDDINLIPPLTDNEIEQYFKKAKECHLNTVELPLEWSYIEKEKDIYDFTLVEKLLNFTNKYDLKCEFLWFSSNMCGDTHGYTIPAYIKDDTKTYPRLEALNLYTSKMYGELFYLVLDNENLMERERLVLSKLMDYVYDYNKQNDNKNPLIGIQVHNEADGLLRWRLDQKKLSLNGISLTQKQVWEMTLNALNNAGLAIKNSKYKIYTRCNMTTSYGVDEFPQCPNTNFSPLDILKLEGIDIIGDDPYSSNPHVINETIKSYNTLNNYPHISENMGDYKTSPALFLSAFQAGGSYMFYDFATPKYFIYLNGNSSYQMDQGLINSDFSYKSHSYETISVVKGIESMGSVIPLINSSSFAAFNINSDTIKNELTQTINTDNLSLTYNTINGGIAFAIELDEYVYIYATKPCTFTINNASFIYKAEIGSFINNEYQVNEEKVINPLIKIEQEKLYRIKIRNINEKVTSTTSLYV